MAKKNNPFIYIVALVLILGGVGWLTWSGFTSDKVYFLNVSEALALSTDEAQACRLFGYVLAEDLYLAGDSLTVSFFLEDTEAPGHVISVTYTGAIPDTFGPGAEVIVEGQILSGSFTANTLMTKCASKYETQPDVIPANTGHPESIPI